MNRKGGASIDKGKSFSKAIAGSMHYKKAGSGSSSQLTQKEKSGVVARAFETASKRTGAFESRNAKK